MAHMIREQGPFPDKAGEFCGNYQPGSASAQGVYETPAEAKKREDEWLSRMRFGRPRPCKTTSVTAENGWVGLYLKEDRPLFDWETPCPTPPELLEPAAAESKGP